MVDDGVDTADIVDIHPNFALRTRQIDTYAEVVKRRKFKKYLKERRLDIMLLISLVHQEQESHTISMISLREKSV